MQGFRKPADKAKPSGIFTYKDSSHSFHSYIIKGPETPHPYQYTHFDYDNRTEENELVFTCSERGTCPVLPFVRHMSITVVCIITYNY